MAAAVEAVRERSTHEGKQQQTLSSNEDCLRRAAFRRRTPARVLARKMKRLTSKRFCNGRLAGGVRLGRWETRFCASLDGRRRDYRAPQISR
jgi:hypothetical protein